MPDSPHSTTPHEQDDLETRELAAIPKPPRRLPKRLLILVALCILALVIGFLLGRATAPTPRVKARRAKPQPPTIRLALVPQITDAQARGDATRVVVTFAQPIDKGSATRPASYAINHGVTIQAAALDRLATTVTLTTSPLRPDLIYTLTAKGLSLAAEAKTPSATFRYSASRRVLRGLVALYGFEEGEGTAVADTSGFDTPLDLTVRNANAVTWVPGGLAVKASTIIASQEAATKLIQACRLVNAITIEAWLTPASLTQRGPARIVSLSKNPLRRLFTLGQQHATYDVRLRTTKAGLNGDSPSLTTSAAVEPKLTHIVYTRDPAGVARVYVNGAFRATGSILGDLSNWD